MPCISAYSKTKHRMKCAFRATVDQGNLATFCERSKEATTKPHTKYNLLTAEQKQMLSFFFLLLLLFSTVFCMQCMKRGKRVCMICRHFVSNVVVVVSFFFLLK